MPALSPPGLLPMRLSGISLTERGRVDGGGDGNDSFEDNDAGEGSLGMGSLGEGGGGLGADANAVMILSSFSPFPNLSAGRPGLAFHFFEDPSGSYASAPGGGTVVVVIVVVTPPPPPPPHPAVSGAPEDDDN